MPGLFFYLLAVFMLGLFFAEGFRQDGSNPLEVFPELLALSLHSLPNFFLGVLFLLLFGPSLLIAEGLIRLTNRSR